RAADMGADVVLVDDGQELGGEALAGGGAGAAGDLAARVRDAGIEVLAPAAGSIEQPLMFEGNDLPGVMLCSGAERLAALYAVRPGKRAVVATTTDRG